MLKSIIVAVIVLCSVNAYAMLNYGGDMGETKTTYYDSSYKVIGYSTE